MPKTQESQSNKNRENKKAEAEPVKSYTTSSEIPTPNIIGKKKAHLEATKDKEKLKENVNEVVTKFFDNTSIWNIASSQGGNLLSLRSMVEGDTLGHTGLLRIDPAGGQSDKSVENFQIQTNSSNHKNSASIASVTIPLNLFFADSLIRDAFILSASEQRTYILNKEVGMEEKKINELKKGQEDNLKSAQDAIKRIIDNSDRNLLEKLLGNFYSSLKPLSDTNLSDIKAKVEEDKDNGIGENWKKEAILGQISALQLQRTNKEGQAADKDKGEGRWVSQVRDGKNAGTKNKHKS